MIKMIAIDLDNTLLDQEWKISPRNREAIHLASARGVKVILATGRMAVSARQYSQQLGLDLPIITYNGALVEQGLSGEIVYRQVIPIPLATDLAEYLFGKKIFFQVYFKDKVFASEPNPYSRYYTQMTGVKVEVADIPKLLAREKEGPDKILCLVERENSQIIEQEIEDKYGQDIHLTSSQNNNLEIVKKGVNKGAALQALAAKWGFKAEEVMAIGDSPNDKEMLSYAGLGVAMANAHPEIKRIADYITSSNEEEGVARAIERFVLTNP
ncbi:MAG: HAD family phosphatase [Peptococcaceae bacterium]|nr:HAD family phosphatase [Peptococcaceae bacterium]